MGRSGCDCVILAAGLSSRMGRWKMVLPYGNSTVIETAVSRALSVVRRVILVTGFRAGEMETMFADHPEVIIRRNGDYRRGMFTSVSTGVSAVTSKRFFVLPGDMPGIFPETYKELLRARQAPVILPEYRGKSGHPVLLDDTVGKVILNEHADSSLEKVLARFPSVRVPVNDENILYDIDTDEDYHARIV
ncbi:MAG: NTP transferase domain-containing protein [Spirochaetia bacterium]